MKEIDILEELEKLDDDIEPGFLCGLQQTAPKGLHLLVMNSVKQEINILSELEKSDEDIEPGFLHVLQQSVPEELHSNVMKSIRQEITPRRRFNYKRYASFTAAAALLVFAFIGGAKDLFNKNIDPREVAKNPTIAFIQSYDNKPSIKKDTADNSSKTVQDNDKKIVNDTTENNEPVPDKKSTTTSKKNNTEIYKRVAVNKTYSTTDFVSVIPSEKPGTTGSKTVAANDVPENINSGSAMDNKANNTTNKNNETSQPNATNSTNTEPSGSQANMDTLSDAAQTSDVNTNASALASINLPVIKSLSSANFKLASLSQNIEINYEINLNMSQTFIIQFIKEKGLKLTEDTYKLNLDDFNMLSQILDDNGISKSKIIDIDSQFVFVKIIMY